MKLLIVESPTKARTISKYLNNEYTVKSSVGHIRDLPKSNKEAIDIKGGFTPHYQIVPGKEDLVLELKRACEEAEEVLLATDPDREGEAIAWHLAQICGLVNSKPKTTIKNQKLKRIVFHEITKEAVAEAIKNPRGIDENLRKAQEARRVLDRLFGYDLSGLIWKKVRYGLSAGRVQSPALRILMEREREIKAFVSEDYWVIAAKTKTTKREDLVLVCTKEPRDEKETNKIVSLGKSGAWVVKGVKEEETERKARAPFTTSTLQQAASTRLGLPPSRTMFLAQRLYEAGLITYMRTDSVSLSANAQKQIVDFVTKEYGKEYALPQVYKTKSRTAQEAHEAIRPTSILKKSAGKNPEQKRLYALIWQRAVASQMFPAKIFRTKITVSVAEDKIPDFVATGSRLRFDGWLAVDQGARGEDTLVPEVKQGDTLKLIDITTEQKKTQPLNRYTEAGLIKELEKRDIGRPSTYASIIKTLVDRNYVNRVTKTLYPTDLGEVVNDFLEKNFSGYISDSFTAKMEDELDEIAEAKRGYVETLEKFYKPFSRDVASKKDIGKITDLGKAPSRMKCPVCRGAMIIKLGRGGKFLSCARFPKCNGARTIEGKEMEGPKETGEACPECKTGKLVEREGRFGKFVGCGAYPKCKYIKPGTGNQQPTTNVKCPLCKKDFITARRGRFGEFYSCSGYPNCKFTIKAKPTGKICQKCNALMMEGTKTIPERCSNKECPNHNPHKIKTA